MKQKTIVLTGGGTAGHIMPNLALLPELEKHFNKIYYLGSANGMEAQILKSYKNITFIDIPTTKFIRKLTIRNLAIPFKLIHSISTTKKILKQINPSVIFCKGGFVSVPVAIAGKRCGVPVISHESDLSMGLANKIILRYANAMCVSFSSTAKNKKCIYTGSPIRKEIYSGVKQNAISSFSGYNSSKQTIMFFGGSLGSKNINLLVEKALPQLIEKYNIIHITGKGNHINFKHPQYLQLEFTNNIQDYFALADMVVCRGGANSLFELLAIKKPMLIIPLSKAQSRGDQIENAKYFKECGYANVMYEEEMSAALLLKNINEIISTKDSYIKAITQTANQNPNKMIVDIILCNSKNS